MKFESVRFKFFWNGFDPSDNFFVTLLKETINNNPKLSPRIRVEFHSVFGRPRRLNLIRTYMRVKIVRFLDHFRGKTMLIWYTGEKIKPPKYYDLTLSFDDNSDKNLYLPLWAIYTSVDNFPIHYDREIPSNHNHLSSLRNLNFDKKIPKICTFISDKDTFRFEIAQQLQEMGLLDGYGRAFGNDVSSKFQVASRYLFQLCLENDSTAGYVTEKPVEAWLAGNIPIYINSDKHNYLNPDAVVDIKDLEVKQIASKIVSITEADPSFYLFKPILLKNYDFGPIQKRIIEFFSFPEKNRSLATR